MTELPHPVWHRPARREHDARGLGLFWFLILPEGEYQIWQGRPTENGKRQPFRYERLNPDGSREAFRLLKDAKTFLEAR